MAEHEVQMRTGPQINTTSVVEGENSFSVTVDEMVHPSGFVTGEITGAELVCAGDNVQLTDDDILNLADLAARYQQAPTAENGMARLREEIRAATNGNNIALDVQNVESPDLGGQNTPLELYCEMKQQEQQGPSR